MKVRVTWTLVTLIANPLVGAAADEPKPSCLKDFTFSQDFLNRHPNAGVICRSGGSEGGAEVGPFRCASSS